MKENYGFLESGLILNLTDHEKLKKFPFKSTDFRIHRDAFNFLVGYHDDTGKFPTKALLLERYPELDSGSYGVDLDYCIKEFRQGKIRRDLLTVIKNNSSLIDDNPLQALQILASEFQRVEKAVDTDIKNYAEEAITRLSEYQERRKHREENAGLLGIPTPFKLVNETGVGFLPGHLSAIFARPQAGKTWLSIKAAAIAAFYGYKTLLVSPEMPRHEVELRLDVVMANMQGIKLSHKALRSGNPIDEHIYERFLTEIGYGDKIDICDNIGREQVTFEGIQQLVRKYRPKFLIIDGIYLITTNKKEGLLWEASHNLFSNLKTFCVAYDIPALVTTQANRDAANEYEVPESQEVAFGDAMIRAADMAFGVARTMGNELSRRLIVRKDRHGDLFGKAFEMVWDVDEGKIEQAAGREI